MRIRTIKPEFFLHEELFELEKETGLPVRLAFIGLWCAADREGRFKWEPRKLRAQILPYDEIDFSRVLHALTTRGLIVKHAWIGREARVNQASETVVFGSIPSFTRHQVINNRERPSDLPDPSKCLESQEVDACPTRAPRVDDACPTALTLGEGEGKGREGKGTRDRADARSSLSARKSFTPPTMHEWVAYAQTLTPSFPQAKAYSAFNHYEANGWMVGKNKMKNWQGACRTCHGRWLDDGGAGQQHQNGSTNGSAFNPAKPHAHDNVPPGMTWNATLGRCEKKVIASDVAETKRSEAAEAEAAEAKRRASLTDDQKRDEDTQTLANFRRLKFDPMKHRGAFHDFDQAIASETRIAS